MLSSSSSSWATLGLGLILCVQGSLGNAQHRQSPNVTEIETETTVIYDPSCSSDVTVIGKTTILSPTTIPVTTYIDIPVTHYIDVTHYVNITSTSTLVEVCTESTTETLHYTVSTTETDLETVSITETDLETITNTETESTTITETTYTTTTIFSTSYDPCPTTCSISAATVNLYFWPTDRPYSYPSTYVDPNLGYTFVSPSVYMYIPTAMGVGSDGPTGPSTSKWMLPLNLYEVSTIVDGSITRQLTLSDIGTDCAQTADPTAIATMVDSRCDPILAAPKEVSSWAYPCNACGRFGLFDPPYAIPTVTGGLIAPTTTAAPVTVTAAPAPVTTPEVGILLIVYYSDGQPVATATVTTTGSSGTQTSSVEVSATSTVLPTSTVLSTSAEISTSESAEPVSSSSLSTTSLATFSATTSSPAATTSAVTASASKVSGGLAWLVVGISAALYLI